jgi:hypothetical protein
VSVGGLTLGVLAVLAGGALVVYSASNLRPAYRVVRGDPVSVRDLVYRDGPVEVRGTAKPYDGQGVRAPFSGTACLVCEYESEEWRSSGNSGSWETLDEGRMAAPFLVKDNTGAVRVDGPAATLHIEPDQLCVSGGEEPPERIARYIERTDDIEQQNDTIDLVVTELNTGNDQRFTERRIEVGESLHVYGGVDSAPAGEWGTDLVDAMLTDGRSDLVVSDTTERGTAWRMARGPLLRVLAGVAVLAFGGWVLLFTLPALA